MKYSNEKRKIFSYQIQDDKIIVEFANGETEDRPNTPEEENKILAEMKKQLIDYYNKESTDSFLRR